MANALGYYNQLVYAQEALITLEQTLGLAARVHRGAEAERNASFAKGDKIRLKRPSSFTAQTAPSTTAQDVSTAELEITLDQWFDVLIALDDKEMSFTKDEMLTTHIRPMAVAVARKFDTYLKETAYKGVADFIDVGATAAPADLVAAQKVLFDNAVPVDDEPNMHFLLDSDMNADFQANSAFSTFNGAGQAGANAQMTGALGLKYGFNLFRNQSVPVHTPGTCNDTALNVVGAFAAGVSTVNIDAVDAGVTGTLVPGDILTFNHAAAGVTRNYVVTNTVTASGNAFTGVTISPPLEYAMADNGLVTFKSTASKRQCLAFHRDFMGFCLAPLSTHGDGKGAVIARAFDPLNGLGIRVTSFYDGLNAKNYLRVDALGGAKVLNPRLACRAYNS